MSASTIGLFVLVVGASLAKCEQVCGLRNIPEFRDAEQVSQGLPAKISGIIPSYSFTCAGVVTKWRARVESGQSFDRYDMTFSVWRTVNSSGTCTYVRVDDNSGSGLVPELGADGEALGSVTLSVHEEDRFSVEVGDFVGFSVRNYEVNGQGYSEGDASVMVDQNTTDLATYVWTTTSLPQTLSCIRELPGGVFTVNPFRVFVAPVITAEIVPVASITGSPPSMTVFGDAATSPVNFTPVPTAPDATLKISISPSGSATGPTVSPPTAGKHSTALLQTAIIVGASLLGMIGVLSIICLASACVILARRRGKKTTLTTTSGQDDQGHEYMEMIQSYIYASHNSLTMPDHYKRRIESQQFKSIYDTLTPRPEPLPRLNPMLSSCSADGPDFLSHSETPTSDYELLYSNISPLSATPAKQRKESCTSIDCPLYSSVFSSSPSSQRPPVLSEEPLYSCLSSPAEPKYDVPKMPHGYENTRWERQSTSTTEPVYEEL